MKLLATTNRYFIAYSILTYLGIACIFYIITEFVIYREVESSLKIEREYFEHYLQQHGLLESSRHLLGNKINFKQVEDTIKPLTAFKDTVLFNHHNASSAPFRQHIFYTSLEDENFEVQIRKSLSESNKLLTYITITMLFLLSTGLVLLFFIQRKVTRDVWKPFYQTLNQIKSFDMSRGNGLIVPEETIHEFKELNQVLKTMTHKIATDYQNMKEFTENAAHEIQTPLALINMQIQELVQGTNFTEQQMHWIKQMHEATMRLSKLHQGLLLLSKIDNGQFMEKTELDFQRLIKRKLENYEEAFGYKKLSVTYSIQEPFKVAIDPFLANTLITNLLSNAMKHNVTNGIIDIETTSTYLKVTNTGTKISINPIKLFERFKKSNQASHSLGLGLAIVKNICDHFDLKVDYINKGNVHEIICYTNTGRMDPL